MHLRVLKQADLVVDQPDGTRRRYRLEPNTLPAVRDHPRLVLGAVADCLQGGRRSACPGGADARPTGNHRSQGGDGRRTAEGGVRRCSRRACLVAGGYRIIESEHPGSRPCSGFVARRSLVQRDAQGVETDWGVVVAWQPPYRILLTWQVDPRWSYVADPLNGSEIEITFTEESPTRTRVALVHRCLERYGEETGQDGFHSGSEGRRAAGGIRPVYGGAIRLARRAPPSIERATFRGSGRKADMFDALPLFYTADIEAAMAFYGGTLGGVQSFQYPAEGAPEHVEYRIGGIVIEHGPARSPDEMAMPEPVRGIPPSSSWSVHRWMRRFPNCAKLVFRFSWIRSIMWLGIVRPILPILMVTGSPSSTPGPEPRVPSGRYERR